MPYKKFELREIGPLIVQVIPYKFKKKLIIADGSFINKCNTHAEVQEDRYHRGLISYQEFGKEPFIHWFTSHELEWGEHRGEYKRFNIVKLKDKPKQKLSIAEEIMLDIAF
jgi:hypothetical protein